MFITVITKTGLRPFISFVAAKTTPLLADERAQTTAEYGLIFALVLVTVVATTIVVGDAVLTLWNSFITAWPT